MSVTTSARHTRVLEGAGVKPSIPAPNLALPKMRSAVSAAGIDIGLLAQSLDWDLARTGGQPKHYEIMEFRNPEPMLHRF